MVDRCRDDRAWRRSTSVALHTRIQQITGEWRALGATGHGRKIILADSGPVGSDATRARVEGAPPLFPRHDTMVAAHTPRRTGRRLRVQHQVSTAAWGRRDLLSGERNSVRE